MCDQTRELVGLDEHDSGSTHHWTYEFKTFCALNSRLKMFDCRVFTLSFEFSMRNQSPSFCLNAKGLQMKWLSNNNSSTFKYQVTKVYSHSQILGTAEAYFVCHSGPKFQISLIYAFIGCP